MNPLKLIAGPPASEEALAKIGIKYTPTVDHVQVPCSVCHHGLWIGPRSLAEYQKDPLNTELVCFCCLAAHLNGRMPDVEHLGGNSGTYEKLEDE